MLLQAGRRGELAEELGQTCLTEPDANAKLRALVVPQGAYEGAGGSQRVQQLFVIERPYMDSSSFANNSSLVLRYDCARISGL